eukprot:TRINITY_DN4493_c0_g1_i6.p2 TRINITY_DN4493_c0_g1~~TRINITY_DN4493_c0_g1_i6.p2  ORF type:complete len:202 (+),score=-19.96 TRINITY_DN4493_c0_g1_i6:495-1100(+)
MLYLLLQPSRIIEGIRNDWTKLCTTLPLLTIHSRYKHIYYDMYKFINACIQTEQEPLRIPKPSQHLFLRKPKMLQKIVRGLVPLIQKVTMHVIYAKEYLITVSHILQRLFFIQTTSALYIKCIACWWYVANMGDHFAQFREMFWAEINIIIIKHQIRQTLLWKFIQPHNLNSTMQIYTLLLSSQKVIFQNNIHTKRLANIM